MQLQKKKIDSWGFMFWDVKLYSFETIDATPSFIVYFSK